ncbi:MAG: uroporphyrinogen decarboxylase family protein [Thermoproteota archaeon]
MMGMERLLISFHKDPKLVHDMFDFFVDFQIEAARKAVEEARIDFATIREDMAYRTGPHISPKMFREFMLQGYKKITAFLRKNGIDIIMVDSDGDIRSLIPLFLEGGVNCFYPLEVQAGMNWIYLRKSFGKMFRAIGNVDKRALIEGPEAIRKEVEAKLSMAKEGGYIPSIDHAVPADVPFPDYVYYIELLKKHLVIRPIDLES